MENDFLNMNLEIPAVILIPMVTHEASEEQYPCLTV